MKTIIRTIIFCALILLPAAKAEAGIVGEWTAYPAFTQVTGAETAGDKVYFLASTNLFSVNTKDETVEVYDKTNSLSDCGIQKIAWCEKTKRLLILYSNYNIDLLCEDGDVINISDYYSKIMTGNKTVNSIDVYDEFAYLSTGFGIVKVNTATAEIADTYNLGFSVDWVFISEFYVYAQSKEKNGKFAARHDSNKQDPSSWFRSGDYQSRGKTVSAEMKELAARYKPDGPDLNEHGKMFVIGNSLYTVPGWGSTSNIRPAYIHIKEGDRWTSINNDISYLTKRRYTGMNALAVDRNDPNHLWGGTRSGLYEFRDGKAVTEYYFENCPLECVASLGPTHPNYTMITAMAFDKDDNLWMFNSSAEHPALYALTPTGEWIVKPHSELEAVGRHNSFERAEEMMIDSRGLMWLVNRDSYTCCLVRYDIEKDKVKRFDSFTNQDGAKFSFLSGTCVVEDKNGNIWFGTDNGLLLLTADRVMTDEDVLDQFKVPRNDGTNLADYLMDGIPITCMAVDGGNRKWIGTYGLGVYVISSDNQQMIHHFTTSNTPLLSDIIECIAIDDQAGEAYISTELGLCSYTMDATTPAEQLDADNILAYPNPVRPDYTGPITITGLTYNSWIKIVTASGQLVSEGQSNGGTYVWDGTNLQGQRVASGVYMVLAATEDGKKGVVCKIAIVR